MKNYARSFAGGEIDTELFGRLDLVKNQTGLARALNFMIMPHGPAANRTGFGYVIETKDSTKKSVLIPFIYSTAQSYVLEFGDQYIRFHTAGGTVLETAQSITSISLANPGVVTKNAHGYANGKWLYMLPAGMTQLNARFVKVAGAAANTFNLTDAAGNNINTTGYGAFTSGTMAAVYEITSPYLEADLFDLHYTQSADVMTIVHCSYQQRELRRAGATNWTLLALAFSPTTLAPTTPTATTGPSSGTARARYRVTTIGPGEESLASRPAQVGVLKVITGITQANPGVLHIIGHGLAVEDAVHVESMAGMTQLNNTEFFVNTVPDVDHITLKTLSSAVVNTATYPAYTGGGLLAFTDVINDLTVAGNRNIITFTVVANATRYNVYKHRNGLYGYIGQTASNAFIDDNIAPDFTQTLPEGTDPFTVADGFPGAVGYFKGRRWFAGTNAKPQTLWGTRSGTESNLTYGIPSRDDDRIEVTLTARQANKILHIVPLSELLLLTSGAEWVVTTVNSDAITPTTIDYRADDNIGASNMQPVVTSKAVLYPQARGGRVRKMKTSDTSVSAQYKTDDISIMAPHLFDGFTLKSLAYTHAPFKTAWFVRSDGVLLGLTFVPEHEVEAWHQHNTDGLFEAACSVPEGNEDVLYVTVQRTINGRTVRSIERQRSRQFNRLQDAFFVDSGVTLNNTQTPTLTPGANATVVGSLGVIFTSGSAWFNSGDVGRYIHYDYTTFNDEGQTVYSRASALITGFTDSTHVTATIEAAWPSLTLIASAGWRMTATVVTGMLHLVGETVSVLADGAVFPQAVVSAAGEITLEQPASVVHVGLPYKSDLKTLPIAAELQAFGAGAMKNISRLSVRVDVSSGLFAGPSFDKLKEAKQRTNEVYGTPPRPVTGIMRVMLTPSWDVEAPICIRQPNPLPLTVVALVPDTSYGGG